MEPLASKDFFEAGLEQFNLAKYGDAIDFFMKGIEIDPNNGFCYLYIGLAYIFQYDLEKARSFIEKAINTELSTRYVHLAKGLRYYYYSNNEWSISKVCSYAYDYFKDAKYGEGIIQGDPLYTYDVILCFYSMTRFEMRFVWDRDKEEIPSYDGIIPLNEALGINNNHAFYYSERGRLYVKDVYYKKSEHFESSYYAEKAIKDFEKALELNPTIAKADFYYNRGLAKAKTTSISRGFFRSEKIDISEAIADIEQAIIMDDSCVQYYEDLAFIYAKQGKESPESYGQAVILYKKAADLTEDEEMKLEYLKAMVTVANLGNIHLDDEYADIEPYVAEQKNNQISGKDIMSSLWGFAKKGMEGLQKNYEKKTAMIEKFKEKYQDYDKEELTQILQNSNSFEEKAAAKKLLMQME